MTPFDLVEPTSLADALALLDPDDALIRPIAGGTALMLMMKAGVFHPTRLVSLRKVKGLSAIALGADGCLNIGALAPLTALEHSAEVARHAPVIVETMRPLANVRVRNVATVGGNLAHGDPHMDLPPVLMALGASVKVAGRSGERTIKVEDLYAGYYETVLRTRRADRRASRLPAQGTRRAAYLKCTTGSTDDWPALGVAVSLEREGAAIRSVTVVVSAATEKTMRLRGAEGVLADSHIDDAVAAPGRRCRRGRSRDGVRYPRLGRLQARAVARLCGARGSPGVRSRYRGGEALMATTGTTGGQVGRSLPRLEARDKVTGRAEYTHNLRLPGMLHGKIVRSTVAHGRIKSIDTSAAQARRGRQPLVTGEDVLEVIPDPYYGPAFHDQPILALGKVRHRRRAGRRRARRRPARRRRGGRS